VKNVTAPPGAYWMELQSTDVQREGTIHFSSRDCQDTKQRKLGFVNIIMPNKISNNTKFYEKEK
jgi:hypothetical protein